MGDATVARIKLMQAFVRRPSRIQCRVNWQSHQHFSRIGTFHRQDSQKRVICTTLKTEEASSSKM